MNKELCSPLVLRKRVHLGAKSPCSSPPSEAPRCPLLLRRATPDSPRRARPLISNDFFESNTNSCSPLKERLGRGGSSGQSADWVVPAMRKRPLIRVGKRRARGSAQGNRVLRGI